MDSQNDFAFLNGISVQSFTDSISEYIQSQKDLKSNFLGDNNSLEPQPQKKIKLEQKEHSNSSEENYSEAQIEFLNSYKNQSRSSQKYSIIPFQQYQLNKKEQIMGKFWEDDEQQNKDQKEKEIKFGLYRYKKDISKVIIQTLQGGAQGRIFKGYDKKVNQKIVFKQFKKEKDYFREKKIYQILKQNIEKIAQFVQLEGVLFDDEYYMIIIPCCECNLAEFSSFYHKKYLENLVKSQNNDLICSKINEFHFEKSVIQHIFSFILQAQAEFEKIGLVYQDLKPHNILIRYSQEKGVSEYKLVLSDFGGVFVKGNDDMKYGDIYTNFFMKKTLKERNLGQKYSDKDIIDDFLFATVKCIQYCLFPCFIEEQHLWKNQTIFEWESIYDQEKIGIFMEKLEKNYGFQVQDIYEKCVKSCNSFQEVYQLFQDIIGQQESKFQVSDMENIVKSIKEGNLSNKIRDKLQNVGQLEQKDLLEVLDVVQELFQSDFSLESYQMLKEIQFQNISDLKIRLKFNYVFANINQELGNWEQSLIYYKICFEIMEQTSIQQQQDMSILDVMYNMAFVFYEQKQFKESILLYKKMLCQIEEEFDNDFRESIKVLNNLGNIYQEIGEFQTAIEYFNKNLVVLQDNFGKNCQESAMCYMNLGSIFKQWKQFDIANDNYQKSLEISERYQDFVLSAETMIHLGNLEQEKGNYEKSVEYYQKSLQIQENVHGIGCFQSSLVLLNLGNVHEKMEKYGKAVEFYSKSVEINEKQFGVSCLQSVDSLVNLGIVKGKMGEMEESIEFYAKGIDILEKNLGKESVQSVKFMVNLGICYEKFGRNEQAIDFYEKGLKIYEEKYGVYVLENEKILISIGNCYEKLGKFDVSIQQFEKSYQIQKKFYGENSQYSVYVVDKLGKLHFNEQKYENALYYHQKCLEILGNDSKESCHTFYQLGKVQEKLKKYENSIELFDKCLKILEQYDDKIGEVDSGNVLYNIGCLYKSLGDLEKSIEIFLKSEQKFDFLYGNLSLQAGNCLNKIGNLYEDLEDLGQAVQFYERCLLIYEKHYGVNCVQSVVVLQDLGVVHELMGENEKAIEYHQRCLEIEEKEYGIQCIQSTDTLNNIGLAYENLGKWDLAVEQYQKSLSIKEKKFGEGCEESAISLHNIGHVWQQKGDMEKAVQFYQKSLQINENYHGFDSIESVDTFYNMGMVYESQGLIEKSNEYYEKSEQIERQNNNLKQQQQK